MNKTINKTTILFKKYSPEILQIVGISGMISTVFLSIKATPKALKIIESNKNEELPKSNIKRKIKYFKQTWKCYIPTIIMGSMSTTCLILATNSNMKRKAALATLCTFTEESLKEYRDSIIKKYGEKKDKEIVEQISSEKINNKELNDVKNISADGVLCYDVISGRYFRAKIEDIEKAVNKINRQMTYDRYVDLNQLYYNIGLDNVVVGDMLGWNIDDGLIQIDYSSALNEDKEPCVVLDYRKLPKYDFY